MFSQPTIAQGVFLDKAKVPDLPKIFLIKLKRNNKTRLAGGL